MHRVFAGACALAFLIAGLGSALTASAGAPPMVPGEVLIKFRPGASQGAIHAILQDLGATRVRHFTRIQADEERITRGNVLDAVRRYAHDPAIQVIEPNWIVSVDRTPNDPVFDQQWALRNAGQNGGLAGADIGATQAWDIQTGSPDVVVAIIDTGIDYTHPDLAPNIWTNPGEIPGNGIDDDGNGYVDDVHGFDFLNHDADPMDDNGHGTHVAGTVAAVGNNGIGVTGVAWNARVMPLKFLGPDGTGPISGAMGAIEYAIEMGARILNNSWGGIGYSSLLAIAIQDAEDAGVLFVAAAGNSGTNNDESPYYPASYTNSNVIAVASTTNRDQLSSFSNFGPASVPIAAPGSNIWSTYLGSTYVSMSGTSMAAPHVSGALAILASQFQEMSAAQLKTVLLKSAEPLPALAGLVGGGRLDLSRMLGGLDSIPPAPIEDLAAGSPGSNRIHLSWTATGDDGAQGTASRYDIRYNLTPIDAANFAACKISSATPTPAPSGSPEGVDVGGLDPQTTYYLAIEAIDEYGNGSPISNVVSATTLGPPHITVSPGSLTASLLTGASTVVPLQITNASSGTLDFRMATPTPPPSSASLQAALMLAKGERDPRVGIAVASDAGGPDVFGHQWIDSRETGGPVFQWTDIRDVGTSVPLSGDDAVSAPVPVGFSFPFYDGQFDSVRICTNGYLSFTSSAAEFNNQPLPNAGAPENLIAPLWDDLYFDAGSSATVYTDGVRCIAQWSNVAHYGGGGPYTFQVILGRDGSVTLQYRELDGPVDQATVGIQNATRGDGLTIAFNAAYLVDSLAVRITGAPRWLSASPTSGTIAPGASASLQVRFDAANLPQGTFAATLAISSNDPDSPLMSVPAHLDVTGAPDLAMDDRPISFGTIFVGGSANRTVSLSNAGVLPLHVTSIQATPSAFQESVPAFDLNPGETRAIEIRFAPSFQGAQTGSLVIASDDPDRATVTIPLEGLGQLPPQAVVSPASLGASVVAGGSATRAFRVRNLGASDLLWKLYAQGGSNTEAVALAPPSAQSEPLDGAKPPAGATAARTGPLQVQLADLAGVRILFDRDHGSASSIAWSTLIASLRSRGATLTENRNAVTADLLNGCDVFWLTDATLAWSDGEIAALKGWVAAGGSLVLEGDNPSSVIIFNSILDALHAGIAYQSVSGVSGLTTRIAEHVTTRGVSRINLEENLATLTTVVPPASVLIEDTAGVPNTAWSIVGSGKVLALADEVFSDFHALFGDNQLFGNQAFDWLGGIGWLRIETASGTVPAGAEASVSVSLDATGLPPGTYAATLVLTSNDPETSTNSISFTLQVADGSSTILAADAHVLPRTFAIGDGSRWMTARFELPPGYDPSRIDQATIRLQGLVPVEPKQVKVGDYNRNGIPDLEIKFDHAAAGDVLAEGDSVEVDVTGEIGASLFSARDFIRVAHPHVTAPRGGEVYFGGAPVRIVWEEPEGSESPYATVEASLDAGSTWSTVAEHAVGDTLDWIAPDYPTVNALVRVFVYDDEGALGSDTSARPFAIRPSITGVETQESAFPRAFMLYPNAPNPFNPSTAIRFDMPVPGHARVAVFGVGGRLVKEWALGALPAGRHQITWDGKDAVGKPAASGVYFLRLDVRGERSFRASRTMLLLK